MDKISSKKLKMYEVKIEIVGIGVLEFIFDNPPTDQEIKDAIIKAIRGIGGRPKDRS